MKRIKIDTNEAFIVEIEEFDLLVQKVIVGSKRDGSFVELIGELKKVDYTRIKERGNNEK